MSFRDTRCVPYFASVIHFGLIHFIPLGGLRSSATVARLAPSRRLLLDRVLMSDVGTPPSEPRATKKRKIIQNFETLVNERLACEKSTRPYLLAPSHGGKNLDISDSTMRDTAAPAAAATFELSRD